MQTLTANPALVEKYNKRKSLMLALSIVFDIIGMLSFIIPGAGETFDLIWAPIAGFAMYIMYGGFIGVFGGIFVFLEELIPFTDVIPSFTIMWILRYVLLNKKTLRQFEQSRSEHALPTTSAPAVPNR